MNAIWLENQQISFRSGLPIPTPDPGEALIRVSLAGVCSTDLELVRGYYPYCGIPGHEFVGQVEVAPGAPQWVNQRVVGEINISCGVCQSCLDGYLTHCEQRQVLGIRNWNGVFADYVILPLKNLHLVPETIPDEAAVFVEPLAAALEILEQVPVLPDHRCLVVGAGRLGQLIAQVLATTGCSLNVVARHPYQQELLTQRDIPWISEQEVDVGRMDIVVDATGTPSGFDIARRAVRPRGIIVLKSTYSGEMSINFSSIVVDEITLVGSRCGPFPAAIQVLSSGQVDPTGLVQATFSLEQGAHALEVASQPGVLKVLINPQAGKAEK
jgi:threonine dehydrogenase-like Zn-dependent dehydrogenase